MISVYVLNKEKYDNCEHLGTWISLPKEPNTLYKELDAIKVNRGSEYLIGDILWDDEVIEGLFYGRNDIFDINHIIRELTQTLKTSQYNLDVFRAIYEYTGDFHLANKIFKDEDFYLINDVATSYQLGYALVNEVGVLGQLEKSIRDVIDYVAVAETYGDNIHFYNNFAVDFQVKVGA